MSHTFDDERKNNLKIEMYVQFVSLAKSQRKNLLLLLRYRKRIGRFCYSKEKKLVTLATVRRKNLLLLYSKEKEFLAFATV